MPPASKKDIVLLIFDLTSSNKQQLLESLLKITIYKSLKTKDNCKLLLVNSVNTNNTRNVCNVTIADIGDSWIDPIQLFKCVSEEEVSKEPTVNLLDVILLAISYLEPADQIQGVVNKQIIYFTSLEHPLHPDPDENIINKIIKELCDKKIWLNFLGVDVALPFILTKPEDVPKSMKKVFVVGKNVTNSNICSVIFK